MTQILSTAALLIVSVGVLPAQPPLARPKPPSVKNRDGIQIPLDAFFVHRLEAAGRPSQPEVSATKLIGRITRDLMGRSPTNDEIREFATSRDKRVFEKTVDRMLESDAFRTRMTKTRAEIRSRPPGPEADRRIAETCWREIFGHDIGENFADARDWLACEYADPTLVNCCELDRIPDARDLKHLVKAIVISAQYRQERDR